jgi:hypothetical protein
VAMCGYAQVRGKVVCKNKNKNTYSKLSNVLLRLDKKKKLRIQKKFIRCAEHVHASVRYRVG